MNLALKAIQKGTNILLSKANTNVAKAVVDNESLFSMAKKVVQGKSEIVNLRLKPDISVPIRPGTIEAKAPSFMINPKNLKDSLSDAELGNLAIRINKYGHIVEPEFKAMLQRLLPEYKVSTRTKGIDSIHSKLKKYIVKKDKSVAKDMDGFKLTTDYMGGRIELNQLTKKEIGDVINNIVIDGKNLTKREKRFVQRLLKNDGSLSKSQIKAGQKYIKPVLSALAEKQSEPAFNNIMLGMMKDALNRKITTIEKLASEGVNPKLLQELQKNASIQPIKVVRLSNYRGPNNVPVFTDNQIRQVEKMQLATGEKFSIATCSEEIDVTKCGIDNLTEVEKSAIKPGGYTRTQMNIELPDGTITELQIAAGKDPFYFIEHDLVYNNLQSKNTINEGIKPFIEKYCSLDKDGKNIFERFSQKCYFDDRLQGLVGTQKIRKNPHGLGKGFSRESMKKLYLQDAAEQKAKMEKFVPYIEEFKSYVA